MHCPNCGENNDNGAAFCRFCGSPLPQGDNAGNDTAGMDSHAGHSNTSSGGGMSSLIKAAGIVVAVLYAVQAVMGLSGLFASFTFLSYGIWGVIPVLVSLIMSILPLLARALMAASALLLAFRYDRDKGNGDSLLLVFISAGILRVALSLVSRLINVIAGAVLRQFSGSFGFTGLLLQLLCVVLAAAVFYVLLMLDGPRPFSMLPEGGIMALFEELPEFLSSELNAMGLEREMKKEGMDPKTGAYTGTVIDPATARMKENRSLLMYYLVGIITCGIYQWYVIYTIARDMNIMCEGDGKKTGGLIKYILLTCITCGIYNLVWHYKLMKRMQEASVRYNFEVKSFANMELGPCWLVLYLLGIVITACGVGVILQIYAEYLMFANLNSLSKAYNENLDNVVY